MLRVLLLLAGAAAIAACSSGHSNDEATAAKIEKALKGMQDVTPVPSIGGVLSDKASGPV